MVRYIKLIYSWSVHPARRRRTHSITVTVRNAHRMASSNTSENDSLPVSSVCKAQRCYESQSRRLNNEGEKFFRASRGRIGATRLYATRLYATPSAVPVPIQNCFLRPCTVSAQPPSTFLDLPLCMYTYTATDSTISKNVNYTIFLLQLVAPLATKVMCGPADVR